MCDHSQYYWNTVRIVNPTGPSKNSFDNGEFKIICSGCNKNINDEIIALVKSNLLSSNCRIWKNSKNQFVKFENIDYAYLKNISNKIKKSLMEPDSVASRKFLTGNSDDTIKEMINYLGEKGLIKK